MKKCRFAEAQIAFALRQAESGTRVAEIFRKLGIAEQTFLPIKVCPEPEKGQICDTVVTRDKKTGSPVPAEIPTTVSGSVN